MWTDQSIYTTFFWNIFNNRSLSVFGIIWYVILMIGLWQVFEKAGEPGWKALIPFYNFYILFKISGIAPLFLIQVACLLLSRFAYWLTGYIFIFAPAGWLLSLGAGLIGFYMWFALSRAFGHGLGFGLGLCLLNPVFIMVLGFGSSRYWRSPWRA